MSGPFPQPEINQLFWCGAILALGVLMSMIHGFIHVDMQQCAQNRSMQHQMDRKSPQELAAIAQMPAKQAVKQFKKIQPVFYLTRFGHLALAGVQAILWPIGLYGTLLGFISLNL